MVQILGPRSDVCNKVLSSMSLFIQAPTLAGSRVWIWSCFSFCPVRCNIRTSLTSRGLLAPSLKVSGNLPGNSSLSAGSRPLSCWTLAVESEQSVCECVGGSGISNLSQTSSELVGMCSSPSTHPQNNSANQNQLLRSLTVQCVSVLIIGELYQKWPQVEIPASFSLTVLIIICVLEISQQNNLDNECSESAPRPVLLTF